MAVQFDNIPAERFPLGYLIALVKTVNELAVRLNAVRVNDTYKVVAFESRRCHRCFPDLAFRKFAVAHHNISFAVKAVQFEAESHAEADGKSLAERTRIGFNTRSLLGFRMSLQTGAEDLEGVDLFFIKNTEFAKSRVLYDNSVPLRENETVTVRFLVILRIIIHFIKIQGRNDVRHRAGSAEVADASRIEIDHVNNVMSELFCKCLQFFNIVSHNASPLLFES